ncbi:MAG: M13 family metallopeptidase, partial [Bacteroidia bacterium]|nr:M13 family metallopeptidase [Bacteroidia bacterium]
MKRYLCICICLLSIGCATEKTNEEHSHKHIDPSEMDLTKTPGNDFYQYANGGWLEQNPCPATESRWTSFDKLREANLKKVDAILNEASAAKSSDKSSDMRKIGDFYRSAMDSVLIDKLGTDPLEPQLSKIKAIKSKEDLFRNIADLQKISLGAPFRMYGSTDSKNSEMVVLYFSQSGLTLPDRDYYLKSGSSDVEIRKDYLKHIENSLKLCGFDETTVQSTANNILEFETAIARASWSRLENRDPHKTYNKYHVDHVRESHKNLDIDFFLNDLQVPKVDSIIIRQPSFVNFLDEALVNTPISTWRNYLAWRYISTMSGDLGDDIAREHFDFFSKRLSGVKKMKPRRKRMQNKVNYALGEIVGKEFVKRHFPAEAKESCLEMVENFLVVYGERIDALDWMSDETKAKAREKLAAFEVKIGYPDKWKDYSDLEIEDGDHFGNITRASQWRFAENIAKIGKPVDRT